MGKTDNNLIANLKDLRKHYWIFLEDLKLCTFYEYEGDNKISSWDGVSEMYFKNGKRIKTDYDGYLIQWNNISQCMKLDTDELQRLFLTETRTFSKGKKRISQGKV